MIRQVRAGRVAIVIALVAALVGATWLYHGYQFGQWPTPGLLVNVYRIDGQLQGDWFADLPPVHWTLAHAFGALPFSAVKPATLVVWLLSLSVLWGAVVSIGRSLRLDWWSTGAIGLLAAQVDLDALGLSGVVQGYLYPTGPSFALGVLGLALVLRERVVLAGLALGMAALAHPNVGSLLIVVIAPLVLLRNPNRRRDAVRLAVSCGVLAVPAFLVVVLDQVGGSSLPASERFVLLADVRIPHHVLFSDFPASEYLATLAWTTIALVSVIVLRRRRETVLLGGACAIVTVLCAIGAAAGAARGPLTLVQLQTPRVSPMLVLCGMLLGGALLWEVAGRWAGPLLIAIAAVAKPIDDRLVPHLSGHVPQFVQIRLDYLSLSFIEAALLALAIVAAWAVMRLRRSSRVTGAVDPRWGLAAAAVLLVVSLISVADTRDFALTPRQVLLAQTADRARELTRPGQLILAPPSTDELSTWARRPTVVTWGAFTFGGHDQEWVSRMNDLTGDPQLLSRALGHDAAHREALGDAAFARRIASSPDLICRWRPALVVTETAQPQPRWIEPVARNALFTLSRVRGGTCPAPK